MTRPKSKALVQLAALAALDRLVRRGVSISSQCRPMVAALRACMPELWWDVAEMAGENEKK